jgi:predicted dehydrogenase
MRIGLIGTVGHTGTVLDGITELEDTELTSVCKGHPNDDLSRIEGHAAFTPETNRYETWIDMLESERLDVVGICRPYHLNAEAVMGSAERGLHVICEKPIATELNDLNRIEKAVSSAGSG